jgi:uncharacterized membrane protein YhfC
MTHLAQPGIGWYVAASVAGLFAIFYPIVLAIVLSKRVRVDAHYAGYGALIFFLFQVISRIPLVQVVGGALAPTLKSSQLAALLWLVALALTAGLFEEVGRYIGYRWLMRREQKTWGKAVLYGVGHGGIESILLVGLSLLGTILISLVFTSVPLTILPASQRAPLIQQYAALAAQPGWYPLLGLWERLWTLPVHIGLSVVVLQVFQRGRLRWLWWAVLAHAVVDFSVVAVQLPLSGHPLLVALVPEALVAVFGAIALWVIRALRPAVRSEDEAPVLPYSLTGEQPR